MAKVVKTTVVDATGKKTSTTKKDTGALSGRQKVKEAKMAHKKSLSNNATLTAVAAEASGTVASALADRERTKRENERQRQETYRSAINKWNGILTSTPDNAEGTDPALEGSSSNDSSTGENPGGNGGANPGNRYGW